jgi:cysteine desulfurase/selenocysteine lyase
MDINKIREDFPIFQESELAYLDNAATSQKPEKVINRLKNFYEEENSNVGRGLYDLASETTQNYESARKTVADFVGATSSSEIVFVRNTSEAINLVAESLDIDGDIVIPEMAHHSNQLPWRRKAEREDLEVKWIPTEKGKLDLEAAREIIDEDTAIVSVSHVSNVFGYVNPIKQLAEIAHQYDAYILVDGAQSVPRMPVKVQELDVDFLAFSGHKMLGPTGIGALYGRKELLEEMDPYQVGGGMIRTVKKDSVEWEELPHKFEAGTPNIAGALGLEAAIEYLEEVGLEEINQHERELARQIMEVLGQMEGVDLVSPEDEEVSVVSFEMENAHPHDIAEILSQNDVAIRAGHHCAQPQMEELGISGTARVSPYMYNTERDVEKFLEAIREVKEVFE